MNAAHGINIGHGWVKYVILHEDGRRDAVVFPATIAPAERRVRGGLRELPSVDHAGRRWVTGEDAQLQERPLTLVSQERLADPAFIPALVKGAHGRFVGLNGARGGVCVSGLPATWCGQPPAVDVGQRHRVTREQALGRLIREAHPFFGRMLVIPESLALWFARSLDDRGQETTETTADAAVMDIGFHTVDIAGVRGGVLLLASLDTWAQGMIEPLRQVRKLLSATFEREFTLHQADAAARRGYLELAGERQELPFGWDRPFLDHGELLGRRAVEAWGRGRQFHEIVLGGGGAASERVVAGIIARFPHARPTETPQIDIALGMARRARRLQLEGQ